MGLVTGPGTSFSIPERNCCRVRAKFRHVRTVENQVALIDECLARHPRKSNNALSARWEGTTFFMAVAMETIRPGSEHPNRVTWP